MIRLHSTVPTRAIPAAIANIAAQRVVYTPTTAYASSTHSNSRLLSLTRSHRPLLFTRSHSHSHSHSHSRLSLNPREKAVSKLLQSIPHPRLKEDIVFSGHLKSVKETDGNVSIVLPLDEEYRELKKRITEVVTPQALDWIKSVRVVMEAAAPAAPSSSTTGTSAKPKDGLANVKHIIAVSSCKGGVGKSTVSVNLAYALSRLPIADGSREFRVGILDADIYGPSLPTMVSPRDRILRLNNSKKIIPPVYEGVKLMSYGFVASNQRAPEKTNPGEKSTATPAGAFIRGPLASAAIRQMAIDTDWGELDYLIIDFPPGTGDIQLTLTQLLKITGAIVVTTPQKLALVDVQKGLDFFRKTSVPILGIVENMSYFLCGSCQTKHRIFGTGGESMFKSIISESDVDGRVIEIPMTPSLSEAGDGGDPFILSIIGSDHVKSTNSPDQVAVRRAYERLAEIVRSSTTDEQVETLQTMSQVKYEPESGMIVLTQSNANTTAPTSIQSSSSSSSVPSSISPSSSVSTYRLSARSLRLSCQCAGCVDEMTGRAKLQLDRVPLDVKPKGIQTRGNYAVAVHWTDGHASSIYPYEAIKKIATKEQ